MSDSDCRIYLSGSERQVIFGLIGVSLVGGQFRKSHPLHFARGTAGAILVIAWHSDANENSLFRHKMNCRNVMGCCTMTESGSPFLSCPSAWPPNANIGSRLSATAPS